jgi:hypothetical protein
LQAGGGAEPVAQLDGGERIEAQVSLNGISLGAKAAVNRLAIAVASKHASPSSADIGARPARASRARSRSCSAPAMPLCESHSPHAIEAAANPASTRCLASASRNAFAAA